MRRKFVMLSSNKSAKFFQRKKLSYDAEVNQRHCLKESEQWLLNVDRTHLVLAGDKLVLQKSC